MRGVEYEAWAMTFVPRFRGEVTVVEEGGRPVLRDTLFGRDLRLDETLAVMARAVDGARSADALIAHAASQKVTRPLAMQALRTLLLLGVFEGTAAAVVESLRALRDGYELPRGAVLPEMRFTCQGAGACCRSISLGPLSAEDVAKLEALDLAPHFPRLEGKSPVELRTLAEGMALRFLRKVDGGCVFLTDDQRCGLHLRFGASAKPLTCQLFPLGAVARFDGVHVYDRGECSRFPVSSMEGAPLATTPQRLLPLMQSPRPIEHPIVSLGGGALVDYGMVAPLVRAAVEESNAVTVTAAEVLRALSRRYQLVLEQLPELPLALEAPEGVGRMVAGVATARLYVPTRPELLAPGYRAVVAVMEGLLKACDAVLASVPESHPQRESRDHARALKPVVHLVRSLVTALIEPSAASPKMIAQGFVSADDPEVQAVLRRSLRQALFGRQALLHERAYPALLRLALVQLVTVFAARQEATGAKLGALDAAHLLAQRAVGLDPVVQVFQEAESLAPLVLEALPYVLRWR